jgi:hypothetical protein
VDEPKDIPARAVRPDIHLRGATPLAHNKPIAEACSQISRAIGAFTICDNNFGSRRSLAQMRDRSPYQRRLVENRNNDRKLHCLIPFANRLFSLTNFPSKEFCWNKKVASRVS